MRDPLAYVLGLGNVLMGDDGFGPAVVRAFEEQYAVGDDVAVVDLGTPGLDLTPWLADVPFAVIVDTIKADLPPGTLRTYDKDDLLRHAPNPRVGPHDPGLKEALHALEFAGRGPRHLHLLGAVPATTRMALDLSEPLRRAVPAAVLLTVTALRNAGRTVRRRDEPLPSTAWWARSRE